MALPRLIFRLVDLVLPLFERAAEEVTKSGSAPTKSIPRPAPTLPAEARGHELDPHPSLKKVYVCRRCHSSGTRVDLADIDCIDLNL